MALFTSRVDLYTSTASKPNSGKSDSVAMSRLNLEMNDILENLGFGVVTLSDEGDNLKINLRQLPECTDKDYADNFLKLFSVLLCGLYKGWFEQTGAPNALKCVVVSLKPQEVVLALKA